MKIQGWVSLFFLFALFSTVSLGTSPAEIYFKMQDPIGDEHGYGTYRYPSNVAFQPYQGLFDITEFKVWSEQPGTIYFDTTFVKVTNPWMAPEGFIHQNLRIMVDSIPKQGQTDLPNKGAYVCFNPKFGWDFCLKVVGWGNSQIITDHDGKLKYQPIKAELLEDKRTIRASVPESLIGKPNRNWKYYVLIGSFDGFGEDFFRKVRKDHGEWHIGGGFDQIGEPQIMDILAYKSGNQNQVKQLKSFDLKNNKLAMLNPVGHRIINLNLRSWFGKFLCLLLIGCLGWGAYRFLRNGQIFWFWAKQPGIKKKNQ